MATTTIKPASTELPNGPAAAALLAGGIGAAVFGLLTLLSEVIAPFGNALNWVNPVGPLSGKSILGTLAFFGSWGILASMWKGREKDFNRIAAIALALLVIGLITTFPPVWHLFIGEE
jgi:hypothetical protein